jgi:hypothetical protein
LRGGVGVTPPLTALLPRVAGSLVALAPPSRRDGMLRRMAEPPTPLRRDRDFVLFLEADALPVESAAVRSEPVT